MRARSLKGKGLLCLHMTCKPLLPSLPINVDCGLKNRAVIMLWLCTKYSGCCTLIPPFVFFLYITKLSYKGCHLRLSLTCRLNCGANALFCILLFFYVTSPPQNLTVMAEHIHLHSFLFFLWWREEINVMNNLKTINVPGFQFPWGHWRFYSG